MGGMIALALLAGGCLPNPAGRARSVSGTIEIDEVHVASRYGGRVEKIFVQEGDALTGGQVLLELEAAELHARRDQTTALLAELEAGPRPQEIQAAKNDWERLIAELEQARVDVKRAEDLFAAKTISAAEREQAVTRARSLDRNSEAAKSRYDLLVAGTRPERLALARAQLAEIEAQLKEMKVVAPSECVLEVLGVKPGDVVGPNRELATLLLPQHLWVRVYVPEPWLGHLKLGDPAKLSVDSDPGTEFSGQIEQIARAAEFTPRNVQTVGERIQQVFGIKVRLNNEQGKLRAGMAADVSFPNAPP
jgi:HlyD family secretion protein